MKPFEVVVAGWVLVLLVLVGVVFASPLICTSQTSISTKLIEGIPAGIVALIVAGIGSWIAYSQYRVARAKLNLDLFEERYKLFEEVWQFLSIAANVNEGTSFHNSFGNLIPKAGFLFGAEIAEFMREANKRRSWLIISYKALATQHDVEHARNISLQTTWLIDAASRCHTKFAPYLDFSEWQAQGTISTAAQAA